MELVPIRCRIPDLLVRVGKNQQWLADKLGIGKQQMSDIIRMRYPDMTLSRAANIAYHLDCQIEDLHQWELR